MAIFSFLFLALVSVQLPQTAAGRQVGAWLQAVNSGDPAKIRAFHGSGKDAKRRIGQDLFLAWETGGVDVQSIESATDTQIEFVGRTRLTDLWMRVTVALEPTGAHAIDRVMVRPAEPPAGSVEHGRLEDAEIARRLGAYVDKLAKADRFAGAVLLVHDGKTVLAKAVGPASRAWNVPNRVDTRFNLGSMNKMFTSVSIGQLLDKGKLTLDDKVGRWLPDFANAEVRDKVTIRQLLSHTSGLGSFFGPKFDEKKLRLREVSDYLPLIAEEKLQFEPGTKWSYSNSGFVLLGAIVEKASGENYFDYVRKHVYAPAGMKSSDCYDVDRDTPNLAAGYTRDDEDGSWWSNVFMHVVRGGPAGGGYSTVEDLVRFANALRDNKLLSPATTREFTTSKSDKLGARYAFGFGDDRVRGHRVVGHSGGFPGISSNLDIYWDDGWVVTVTSNVDMGAQAVNQKAREWIVREP